VHFSKASPEFSKAVFEFLRPKRDMVSQPMVAKTGFWVRGFVGLWRSTYRRRSVRSTASPLCDRLRTLAGEWPRYGYRRLHVLLRSEGWTLNHKRLLRLYQAQGLAVRRRRRKRVAGVRTPIVPTRPNERWSMDFVTDALGTGRSFRVLTIVDDRTRECLALEPDTSLPGSRVVEILI
jgi:putative transposase